MSPRKLTQEETQEARQMARSGVGFDVIAQRFGCHAQTVRRAVDPEYGERRRETVRQNRLSHGYAARATEADWRSRLAEVPRDTRDLTAHLLGDPLPGRSALDRRVI